MNVCITSSMFVTYWPMVDILKVGSENQVHLVVDDGIALICLITLNLSTIVSLYLCVFYCQISEGKTLLIYSFGILQYQKEIPRWICNCMNS